jgi:hypothetical protein
MPPPPRDHVVDPAWRNLADPIERIFSLLGHYRALIVETGGQDERSMGGAALETREPDARVRDLAAARFRARTDAVLECLFQAGHRLPDTLDRLSLAEFVVTTTEGALLQARLFRDVAYFDRAVQELRNYIEVLLYGRPIPSAPIRRVLAGMGR